jgi:hypothetical protein
MQLEQTLQIYEPQSRILGRIYTSGLEMYTLGMGPKPINLSLSSIGGPKPLRCASGIDKYDSINPLLEGGVNIDLDKSTPNTVILKEMIEECFQNIYIHHDGKNSPGRMIELAKKKK